MAEQEAPRTRSGSRKEPGTVSLLAEILDGRPNLPDARCRTNSELFDDIADGIVAATKAPRKFFSSRSAVTSS